MTKLTLKSVRALAVAAGKKVVYNRPTGVYQVVHGFTASEGVMPARDEKRKLHLDQAELKLLASYI